MPENEEKSIHEVVQEAVTAAVAQAMKPIFWSISGIMFTVLAIFITVAWPLTSRVSDLHSDVVNKVNSEEAYSNFLTKQQYNILQKNEHRWDKEAILNPKLCIQMYQEADKERAENLEIRYRSAE